MKPQKLRIADKGQKLQQQAESKREQERVNNAHR